MGYFAVWKMLERMVTDFKKKGAIVPAEITDDLKSARTIIKIVQADPTCVENAQNIEQYLGKIEIYLISEGERRFGRAYVDEWLTRIDQASRKTPDDEEEKVRFISDLPREQKWIRLEPSAEMPLDKLVALADESNLSHKVQTDGHLLVHGPEKLLKDFVKKISADYKSKSGKEHQKVRNC